MSTCHNLCSPVHVPYRVGGLDSSELYWENGFVSLLLSTGKHISQRIYSHILVKMNNDGLSLFEKKVCQCPKVLAANILPGVFALCLIISFSKIWKNSEILDFSPIFGNLPVKKLNFAVFWWGYYILDNINTALAKSNFINMAPIFGSRSDKYGSYFEFWSRQSSISLIICSSLQTYGIIQGGRSCAGARGALAEKFGLGRKF